ncbi:MULTISPECIES: YbaN family protein [unclassified Colwellia]|uniref:YbaN family protein n=1 Tax=unclassified Colwellia TaxID=196834 RepID=UPI0015F3542F|nr:MULTISPECIES: YbaN family protein [unclassified Colwellia]MBA6232451.1 YbaN family protein [Colwellia sp. MB02u-7]MBA6238308.1 YbaN family protein [Colwellia sp. MB02u-11]MBA6254558.1 YbaN family protein [Colwellia sp. MB3u-28]MBA6258271.1 YbaN family protein [Colwellia sp. MB3u-41]MBA6301058.1 YbaN family protein [Colwellia sp. MB3u-22]
MLLKIAGIFFVALAILGVVLPILPTTPFLLVSGACFAKSSPKMYKMLLDNKVFGPLIYHWQASRSLPRSAKIIALTSIVLASSWSCYLLDNNILRIVIIALVTGPFVFLWRLPISDGNKQT